MRTTFRSIKKIQKKYSILTLPGISMSQALPLFFNKKIFQIMLNFINTYQNSTVWKYVLNLIPIKSQQISLNSNNKTFRGKTKYFLKFIKFFIYLCLWLDLSSWSLLHRTQPQLIQKGR